MSNDSIENDDFSLKLTSILCFFSILLSLFFVLILNKKDSNYARIVRHIVMSEGIYIYCFLETLDRKHEFFLYNSKKISRQFLHYITFKLFEDSNENKMITDKDDKIFKFLDIINLAGYYSMEIFSLTLSIFICLELILILKNPIAQMKSRLKPYFIISSFLAITIFIMICTVKLTIEEQDYDLEEYLFLDKFQL